MKRIISTCCLFAVLLCSTACESKTKGEKVSTEKPEITQEELAKFVSYLNSIKEFPVEMSNVEKTTGIPFQKRFSSDSYISQYGNLNMSLSLRKIDEKLMLTEVSISADPEKIPIPEKPPGTKFSQSNYRYLPQYAMSAKLGDKYYRTLSYPDQEEYREVNGTDGRINSAKWEYTINEKRGHFISEEEQKGFKTAVLGLLNAIKENRFEAHLKEFEMQFPKQRYGNHLLYGHSLTIMYFNNKEGGEHFGKHLKDDGLSEYVGLHFNPEQHGEFKFTKPYLFDFFGIEHLDALQKPGMRPYAGLKDTGTPNPAPPIDEATAKAMLPDISAAGHRHGGLAYYVEPRYVADGWNFWMPGFYPHDGKKVERYLKKDKYLSNSFEVLFSRKK